MQQPKIHTKSTKNRPKTDPKATQKPTQNRPKINPKSTQNRPNLTQNDPHFCDVMVMLQVKNRHGKSRQNPSRLRSRQESNRRNKREDCNFCATSLLITLRPDADAHAFGSLSALHTHCCPSTRPVQTHSGFTGLPPSNVQGVLTGGAQPSLPLLHNRIATCTSHLLWG